MTDAEYKHVLYGLIFFSLLKKEFYTGAKQLVETGFVRVFMNKKYIKLTAS